MSERKQQWLEDGAKNGWEPMGPAARTTLTATDFSHDPFPPGTRQ